LKNSRKLDIFKKMNFKEFIVGDDKNRIKKQNNSSISNANYITLDYNNESKINTDFGMRLVYTGILLFSLIIVTLLTFHLNKKLFTLATN
jgi:hypothetical protein